MPAETLIEIQRLALEIVHKAAGGAAAMTQPGPPASQATIAPLDVPSLYPAVNKADEVRIAKIDDDEGLVFGWASISATADGQLVVDAHDDIIEPAELEKAAYEYVLKFAEAGEMHQGGAVGQLVESLVLTKEKAEAMGIPHPMNTAWWVGFKIEDADVFAKVKDGSYPAFSIQGLAQRDEDDG